MEGGCNKDTDKLEAIVTLHIVASYDNASSNNNNNYDDDDKFVKSFGPLKGPIDDFFLMTTNLLQVHISYINEIENDNKDDDDIIKDDNNDNDNASKKSEDSGKE